MAAPEIKVDELMHQIRQTVAQRVKQNDGNEEAHSEGANGSETALGQIDGSGLRLQPDFDPHPAGGYHVNDLLKYHGEAFVRNAYRAILNRDPDEIGFAHHMDGLAGGRLNKIDVLASLRYSSEGQKVGINLSGLAWPATIRRIERLPVIGYVLQLAIAIARLPTMRRHQRQQEFYVISRQEQLVEYANRLSRQITDAANEFSSRASTTETEIRVQRQAIDSLRGELDSRVRGLQDEIAATNAALAEVEARLATLTARVTEKAANADARADNFEADLERLATTHERLSADLGLQERRLADLAELAEVQSGANEEGLDELYAAFEDQFRGARDEIKNRLRVYLPILDVAKVRTDVLDVGCGRGEWLELLRDCGIKARGVDHNRTFIDRCRSMDLDVIERDAITYLRGLPEQSVNAIASFHLVEHLPFKTLLKLLDEMVRVLRPNSPLILETPNPENFIVGSHTFYTDPTHRNPIPSATLRFLLESRGLGRIEIMKVRPWDEAKLPGDDELTKRFNEYFYSSPDYGIVGWKI